MTTPVIELPCTVCIGSDRYAARVVEIHSAKNVSICILNAQGETSPAAYERWSLRKDGQWRRKGKYGRAACSYLVLGHAENYRDPSF